MSSLRSVPAAAEPGYNDEANLIMTREHAALDADAAAIRTLRAIRASS